MNVLVLQLPDEDTTPLVGIHLPPADFVPPAPEQWEDYADLRAACGFPFADTMIAGYGQLDVVRLSEGMGQLRVVYCMLCFPAGPPG